MARTPRIPLSLLALSLAGGSCFEPGPAPLAYTLAPATADAFAEDGVARKRLEAQLLAAFGAPDDPRYAPIEGWREPGLDPDQPELAAGSREIGAAELERIGAANRKTFARALAALAAGDLDGADPPRRFRSLRRALERLRADVRAGRASTAECGQRGRELLEGWYPSLAESAELYRVECLHCHGVAGGGDGPTAHFLEPRPRDFRQGVFKYSALAQPARPRREDLVRTLTEGLNGTSMPNFARLSLAERHGLADYVRFLSIRGEVERRAAAGFADEGELADDAVALETADVWEKWTAADAAPVVAESEVPPLTAEIVARGSALYRDATKGNCASCHGEVGAGDGPAAWKIGLDGRREAAYLDAWDRPIVPRDLRLGIYRGGSRPIDLYRRIWTGIAGTPMPALGAARAADGSPVVTGADVWALVHYVRSLAYAAPER